MKLSLEKINKVILLFAIIFLIYRKGSFGAFGVPKPFEIIFLVAVAVAVADLSLQKKWKEAITSVPKKVWGALGIFTFSTLIGWGTWVLVKGLSTTRNMLLEIGAYGVSVITFLLVTWYAGRDERYGKWYLYALLSSVVFVLLLISPSLAVVLGLSDGAFNGLTDNVSVSSRMFLLPAVFFMAYSIGEKRRLWIKISAAILAAGSVALVFWAVERGTILATLLGAMIVWILSVQHGERTLSVFGRGVFLVGIIAVGFFMTPAIGKRIVLDRILNPDTQQTNFEALAQKRTSQVVKDSVAFTKQRKDFSSESRLTLWPFYLQYGALYPFGIGPNTHVEVSINHVQRTFQHPGPHNTYIQTFLWGGIAAFLGFLYLIWGAVQNLRIKIHDNFQYYGALASMFLSLAISMVFNDNLQLYSFWILLALAYTPWIRR